MIARDWKVVSFQKATALAMLAAASAAAAVTANMRAIWGAVTPPKRPASANTGTADTSRRNTRRRLPVSFPTTSCQSSSRLTRSSSSVRRSFSAPTATALASAATSTASASWSGARMRNNVAAKRAVSPAVATAWVPVTTSQQVTTIPRSAPQ